MVVEEKRSTNSRVNRVWFSAERGYGFRNNMEAAEAILVVISMGGLSLVIGVVTIEEDFQTVELLADIRGMITWGGTNHGVGLLSMEQPKLWHPGYLLLLDKP